MKKLLTASLLLVALFVLQTNAFAQTKTYKCQFKDSAVEGIKSLEISEESLLINKVMEIPLQKSTVKCGNFGKQMRLDGSALGYMVVLKSCSSDAKLEGDLIDSVKEVAAEVICD